MKVLRSLPVRGFLALSVLLCFAVPSTLLARDGCRLQSDDGRIKHVVYVQFDNTHFLRNNPNVPSDLGVVAAKNQGA